MPKLDFFVPGVPAPGGSKSFKGISKKTGHAILVDACKRAPDWKATVKRFAYQAMQKAGLKPEDFNAPLASTMTFYMPIPKTFLRGKNARVSGSPHTIKPDITKLTRPVEDAMTGTAYPDDALIARENEKNKIWCLPGSEGIHIIIETFE